MSNATLLRAITKLAAECHRAKWQFDLSEDYRPTVKTARALIAKAFDELHRVGDLALKERDTLREAASQGNGDPAQAALGGVGTADDILRLANVVDEARLAYLDAYMLGLEDMDAKEEALRQVLWDDKGTWGPALRELARRLRSPDVAATPLSREAVARAIHNGLGGNGWAYMNYGGDEWNTNRDKLLNAAGAVLALSSAERQRCEYGTGLCTHRPDCRCL